MSIHADRILAVRTSKTVYHDGDTVIKVFDEDYSKADVLNEALSQARVEETSLSVPRLYAVKMLEGRWAIVSQYIEGNKLQQMMYDNPEREDEYLSLFVDLQRAIHAEPCPMMPDLKNKMYRKIEIAPLEEAARSALKAELDSLPSGRALCHGDLIPSNVMIDEAGKPYILDWSHATQGNACADVARTYLLFQMQGYEQKAEKYLALYCGRTGISAEEVKQWLQVVAASHLKRGRPAEREFMKRWLEGHSA